MNQMITMKINWSLGTACAYHYIMKYFCVSLDNNLYQLDSYKKLGTL